MLGENGVGVFSGPVDAAVAAPVHPCTRGSAVFASPERDL